MVRSRLLVAGGLLACCLALAPPAGAQVSPSGLYTRPPQQPPLPETHERLARSPAANAHTPEQVGCRRWRQVIAGAG